jgi:hypothetical protein
MPASAENVPRYVESESRPAPGHSGNEGDHFPRSVQIAVPEPCFVNYQSKIMVHIFIAMNSDRCNRKYMRCSGSIKFWVNPVNIPIGVAFRIELPQKK